MSPPSAVAFAHQGHEQLLEALCERLGLSTDVTFRSRNTLCARVHGPGNEGLFVKIKGYEKNPGNVARFKRAALANRAASRVARGIMPATKEFRAFEDNGVLWITSLMEDAGEPCSRAPFFDGNEALIDDAVIGRLAYILAATSDTPAAGIFYKPRTVSRVIVRAFGKRVTSTAAHWDSAHCDFHWANIMQGARRVIDWDMFALAPRGFDLASILLFSSHRPELYGRLSKTFADRMADPCFKVAARFAAARLLRLMRLEEFRDMALHREAVIGAVKKLCGNRPTEP